MYVYIYIYIHIHTHIYIYRERERQRDIHIHIHNTAPFMLGVDYKFTNYNFRQPLNFKTAHGLSSLWQDTVYKFKVLFETIVGESVVKYPHEPCRARRARRDAPVAKLS